MEALLERRTLYLCLHPLTQNHQKQILWCNNQTNELQLPLKSAFQNHPLPSNPNVLIKKNTFFNIIHYKLRLVLGNVINKLTQSLMHDIVGQVVATQDLWLQIYLLLTGPSHERS